MRSILLSILLLLTGCATTPLQTGFPAEAVGKGKVEAALVMQGVAPANAPFIVASAARARYGIADRWDLIAATEFETLTVLAKWTLVDAGGFHFAPLFGASLAWGDVSCTLGWMADVAFGPVTPYVALRYQAARVDATRIDGALLAGPVPERFDFFSATLGARWRITDVLALNFESVFPFATTKFRYNAGPILATQMAFQLN